MENKHIDLTYLKEFSRGDNAFIVEMINTYLDQTPEILASIQAALDAKNWPALRGHVHKMKPSMTFMGIHELEDVVMQLEDLAARQVSLDVIPILTKRLIDVCTQTLSELEEEKKLYLA